jgi:thioredoxin reductase
MAVKSFGVGSSGVLAMAEGAGPTALFAAVQTAVAAALVVPAIDADVPSETAVAAIGTASTAVETAINAQPVTLLVTSTLTRKQIFDGLDAIKAHINSNNLFAQGS